METHKGKSVPIVKNFQIEGSWVPTTPAKPPLPNFGQIYENGEAEAYLSRFSHQNQAQTLLSYSISSAETNNLNIPSSSSSSHINNFWDGGINLQRENNNVEMQRRGLEEYLPNWNSQGRRTKVNYPAVNHPEVGVGVGAAGQSGNFPYLSPWESSLQWRNNGVRDNGSAVLGPDQLDQLQNAPMSFGDLLAMNGSAAYMPGWDCNVPANTSSILGGNSMFYNQNNLQQHNLQQNTVQQHSLQQHNLQQTDLRQQTLHQHNLQPFDQQIRDIFGEMQSASHPYQGICDANSLNTKHANGKNSTFVPSTPDARWRIDSNMALENTPLGNSPLGPYQSPFNEQIGLPEQDVAAAMVNLQNVQEEAVVPNTAESSPGKASVAVESHSPDNDKGGDQVIDLNKTPQKKPRRRRYQPKVLSEKKPKRTPKPKTPKPNTDPKETATVRRKYVRKSKVNAPSTPPEEGATEAGEKTPTAETEAGTTKPTVTAKSCRKSLNFDLNGLAAESTQMLNGDSCVEPQPNTCDTAGERYSHTVHLRQGEELVVETSRGGTAYDLNRDSCQELKHYLSLPTKDSPNISQSRKDVHLGQSPSSSPCASSNEQEKTRGTKRNNSCITGVDAKTVDASQCTFWKPSDTMSRNTTIGELHKIFFPEICKKKRTEKVIRAHVTSTSSTTAPSEYVNQVAGTQNYPRVDPTASKYFCNPASFGANPVVDDHAKVLMGSIENREQLVNTWADLARLKKKRSKGATRVRNLDPLKGIASPLPAKPGPKGPRKKINNDNLQPPVAYDIQPCPEDLPADSKTNPRSKRRSRKQNSSNQWDLVLYNQSSTRKATGSNPVLPWVKSSSSSNPVEEITERLRLLDINKINSNTKRREKNSVVVYNRKKQEQNAMVVYGRDGTMVPFDGPFDPIRKRRQRAKVDLDDETTRVWRLLLENIDNKGIDGSDEDKAKWWENERSVFRGRVDSFIARMRLVQGDRRFTPWKGSVLDSVIGVFLTQNVSDHLSSSAFMAMAAHFPLKSESSESTISEESTTAFVEEPDVTEPEECIAWNEKTMDQHILSSNPRIINVIDHIEEKEVVNSKEPRGPGSVSPNDCSSESCQKVNNATSQTTEPETASVLGDDRAKDDATSSQQSVMSSQNSNNSPNLQTTGMMSLFSESSSRTQPMTTSSPGNYFDYSTSFLGLLKMAESPFGHEPYSQTQHDPLECMNHMTKGSLEAQRVCPPDNLLNLNFQLPDTKGVDLSEEDSRSPDTSRKDENSSPTEQSNLTTESTMQHLARERSSDSIPRSFAENTCSFYVLEGEQMVMQPHSQSVEPSDVIASSVNKQTSSTSKSTNLSQVTADYTGSTTESKRTSSNQKEVEQIPAQPFASGGIPDLMNEESSKSKKGKPGKGKNNTFDWDSLRREAQANGRIKERTANTRDSLDWEAVRHAHVSEIAETIKERGMNNMLAERIKALLDRLVKDHGSTDMEWLRYIPPDKAKEYLLSFRGLGLKSVECVRLLTLHHLAFPVDTNVGRIAVRLGWVPLQPLPESLQLHLLEMYPILESIQKFLWPRLCKLDQKTLYELHYHLITFGKVFCTKRQPNCNACPLRGECRHFASAFASARFALPGPEEKGIIPSSGANSTNTHPPQASINPLSLPFPWSSQHSHNNSRCTNGAPLLEVSSSPLALPSPQTMNHMERQSDIRNCEPIVEVPASPEPEPEIEQSLYDIEDTFCEEDPDEIPTIKLNLNELTQTIQKYVQANKGLEEVGNSNALVTLTPEAASIPTPKLKNISRLRTEHHVYELPDTHPLLKGLDKREHDDPSSYLLAIWTPGETAESIQPPERRCNSEDASLLCNEETCSYCSSMREANSQIVRGTILIPCRTAMRGSFPLNGTYFQVNEVFADHASSLNPIAVPRSWLWNLSRRTVYFGTSIPTIFRGLTTEDIQHCFWRGFVCVRGFDQKRRAPRPLMARLHFPASRMPRGTKGKAYDE